MKKRRKKESQSLRANLAKLRYYRYERLNIYATAGKIRAIRAQYCLELTAEEKGLLLRMLEKARTGRLPLANWLPRGYQIARILSHVMYFLPAAGEKPTERDLELIALAVRHYEKDTSDRRNSRRQLLSLLATCEEIGISQSSIRAH